MTFMTFKQQVTHLIDAGRPFDEIEACIESAPLNDEEQSALWVCAWSLTDLRAGERSAALTCRYSPLRPAPAVISHTSLQMAWLSISQTRKSK